MTLDLVGLCGLVVRKSMSDNPLGAKLKSWWAGPISWQWMLLITLALLSMMFVPLVAVIYSGLGK